MRSRNICRAPLLRATLLLCLSVTPAAAQLNLHALPGPPPQIPFDEWMRIGERKEIKWDVQVRKPALSFVQRMSVLIDVSVDGRSLRKEGGTKVLWLFAALGIADGWIGERGALGVRLDALPAKEDDLVFHLQAFVQPGEYRLGLALFDEISGRRSVRIKKIIVKPLGNDPLPDAARALPRVQFLRASPSSDEAVPAPDGSTLLLPAQTKSPVRVEVVVNFSPTERMLPRRDSYQNTVDQMMGLLHVLSQLRLPNGALHVTAVDATRREVFFEQEIAGELDLPRLRQSLKAATPFAVSADVLKEQSERAAFFRRVLQSRIEANAATNRAPARAAAQASEPRRVLIVVSPPYEFASGSRVLPLELARGDVRIVHLRSYVGGQFNYAPPPTASRGRGFPRGGSVAVQIVADEIERFFEGLDVRRFELETPIDFRRALAAILADLRAM